MRNTKVTLEQLEESDRQQFVLDNQRAFKFGALEEFGRRDDHSEDGEEIISAKTINRCIDGKNAETYRIVYEGRKVGGVVLSIDKRHRRGDLELLFVAPEEHSRGIGYAAWCAVEEMHPEIRLWETCTPYFETRNIHFYVNRCGFHIVEFFNKYHPEPFDPDDDEYERGDEVEEDDDDGMFRFEKRIARKRDSKS